MMKSNIILYNKQIEMKNRNLMDGDGTVTEEEEKNPDDDEEEYNIIVPAKLKITNQQASVIFSKLEELQNKKSYYAKKNWTDDESKLLLWAIDKYCRGK
jgi:hypothetical protein